MSRAQSTVTLKKWGNSIGLVLPAALAKEARVFSGTKVEIALGDEALVVRKAAGQSHIEELCAGITPENLHPESDWGAPQGGEAW